MFILAHQTVTGVDVFKTIVSPIITKLFEALQTSARVRFRDYPCTQSDGGSASGGCQTPRNSTTPGIDWGCQGLNTRV